jgi:antitoxin YefM
LRTGFRYATSRQSDGFRNDLFELRANLAAVLDRVVDDREVVVVRRKDGRDVALVTAEELAGLEETAHLLRSPRNARRLLGALRRSEKRQGKPMSMAQLRREIGLGSER